MFIKQLNTQSVSPLSNSFLFEVANIPDEDQNLVKKLSLRALNMVYTYTNGRVVTETDFEIYVDLADITEKYRLPVRPLFDITSIQTFDDKNIATTMDTSKYYFVVGDNTLFFNDVPTNVRPERSMKITMKAGYDPLNIPIDLLAAVEQLTIFLYENRGDNNETRELPVSVRLLLDPYVVHRL